MGFINEMLWTLIESEEHTERYEKINWIGLAAVPIASACLSLLFVPAPFLRSLNGVPLSLYTSVGLLIGSLIGWSTNKFEGTADGKFFHPAMMIGGCAFVFFFVLGVFAVRLLGLSGGGSVLSGLAVIVLGLFDHFGLFALPKLDFPSVERDASEEKQWLVIIAAGIVIVGVVLGMCVPLRDLLGKRSSKRSASGYEIIEAINSELGNFGDDAFGNVDPLADSNRPKKTRRSPRPSSSEALADSAVTRWFTKRSAGFLRITGILCGILSAGFLVLQLAWLLYAHSNAMKVVVTETTSLPAGLKPSSSDGLHRIPFSDLFSFACGALITAVAFVVVCGLIARNQPSLPSQGALPCVVAGILYVLALYAWLYSRTELIGSIGDSLSWGLSSIFTGVWSLCFGEQKGLSSHLIALSSILVVVTGSVFLGFTQRGFHNL